MKALAVSLVALLWAAPALGQPMDPNMPGMKMSPSGHAPKGANPARKASAKRTHKARRGSAHRDHRRGGQSVAGAMPGMDMSGPGATAGPAPVQPDAAPAMPGMDMSGQAAQPTTQPQADASSMPGMPNTSVVIGVSMKEASPEAPSPQTPPPPPATDHAADRYYDPAAMADARHMMRTEMGGTRFAKVMANLAEYQAGSGGGYRWDGEAWFGGDLNRLVVRTEGEGSVGSGLESGEVQALHSRAVGPYTDLQAGVRQDFSPRGRTYLAVGARKLLPYWFDVEGALFLSTKGEFLARLEGTYDLRLFQRVVLQPRAELNFAAQDTPQTRTGSGLSNAELGLRLRYEIRREFAPYIGVSWDRRFGRTADYWRAAGDNAQSTTFVVGLRTWF